LATFIRICENPANVAETFSVDLAALFQDEWAGRDTVSIALSGGSTPRMLFELWAKCFKADRDSADNQAAYASIDWSRVHFFWGDERCVPPASPESNYGVARELFLTAAEIDTNNIHRVMGEADPQVERQRYQDEILQHVRIEEGLPRFDLVLLGMGDDGHTASIFPDQMQLWNSPRVCEVATHPVSGQQRITLTGEVINAADRVAFLVTGGGKAQVLASVLEGGQEKQRFPAALVDAPVTTFYVDQAAASDLKKGKEH